MSIVESLRNPLVLIGIAGLAGAGMWLYSKNRPVEIPSLPTGPHVPPPPAAPPPAQEVAEQFRLQLASATGVGYPFQVEVYASVSHQGPSRPVDLWVGVEPEGQPTDWIGHQRITVGDDHVWVDYGVNVKSQVDNIPGYWNVHLQLWEPTSKVLMAYADYQRQLRLM